MSNTSRFYTSRIPTVDEAAEANRDLLGEETLMLSEKFAAPARSKEDASFNLPVHHGRGHTNGVDYCFKVWSRRRRFGED